MIYSRPPFPVALYKKFRETAAALGYAKRGTCWKLLDMLLDYAILHPDLFRNRSGKATGGYIIPPNYPDEVKGRLVETIEKHLSSQS